MGEVMVTWLFYNLAVCRDAARRAGLSATAELLDTRATLASAGIKAPSSSDWLIDCVCVCVCLSVSRRYCGKTAKRRITQTTPRDTPGTLIFWREQTHDPDNKQLLQQVQQHRPQRSFQQPHRPKPKSGSSRRPNAYSGNPH